MMSTVIRNASIVDGTGSPAYVADVFIREGVIQKIAPKITQAADQTIDATGLTLTPGFIDCNNHADTFWHIFNTPTLPNLVGQGITTIVGGNAGASLAPLATPDALLAIQRWTDVQRLNFNWQTYGELAYEIEKRRLSVNFTSLAGQSTLRRGVMKKPFDPATDTEVHTMNEWLRRALSDGALGLSTSVSAAHARATYPSELIALLRSVAKRGALYVAYLRDEQSGLISALRETIGIAGEARVKLHLSHLKAVGKSAWADFPRALDIVAEYPHVTFDIYPYTFTGVTLQGLLPAWLTTGGQQALLSRLADSHNVERLIRELADYQISWDEVVLQILDKPELYHERKLGDLARDQESDALHTLVRVILATEGRAVVGAPLLSEENVRLALAHPQSIISTNGAGYLLSEASTGNLAHPRNFGSTARVLAKYVQSEKLLTLEQAVHKMTGKPAAVFNISRRGVIREGNFADLVLLDMAKVGEVGDYEDPYHHPTGFVQVWVNGVPNFTDGIPNGNRAGLTLHRPGRSWFPWMR